MLAKEQASNLGIVLVDAVRYFKLAFGNADALADRPAVNGHELCIGDIEC